VNKHGGVIGFVVRPRVNRINGDRYASVGPRPRLAERVLKAG
jgi:hypothetical protein